MTEQELVDLNNKIQSLDKNIHIEIFKIFHKHNVPYSENKNGIFINLSEVKEDVIDEVYKHLEYIQAQEKELNIIEKEKQFYQDTFFTKTS